MTVTRPKPRVCFFNFELDHTSVGRRLDDASSDCYELIVYKNTVKRTITPLLQRVFSTVYLKGFWHLLHGQYDILWAQGVDACFLSGLAAFFRRKVLVWDVSDINPRLTGRGLKGKTLRFLERRMLRRVDHLILSTPSYYDFYFRDSFPADNVTVIENLLLPEPVSPTFPIAASGRLTVVYSGIFRSRRLLELMRQVAVEMPDEVEFNLYGSPDHTVGKEYLTSLTEGVPNFRYHGKFRYLADIHADNHVIFAMVDTDSDSNEKWLLNNRLYHAAAFQRPLIASEGAFSGQVAHDRKLGLTAPLSQQGLCAVVQALRADTFAQYQVLRAALPPPETAYLNGNYRRVFEAVLDTCQRAK